MSIHLEDIQQTVIYIPYDGDDSDASAEPTLPSTPVDNDLEDGPQLRFDAYKAAWTRCLDRLKAIIAELYTPVVSGVTDRLDSIHGDILPGLPFPELPVITIADLSGGSVFLDHLSGRLDEDTTFTQPKRKPVASLAPYDLNLLQAWYDAAKEPRPSLVVLLHDFEQFDTNVVQDMLYICSLQVARLPLTFILSLSTPSPASYLQASFTRSTLALLKIYHFAVPSGREVLHTIILKTFFDPTFDLHLLPGPTLLESIEDYYTTHSPSLDALITILQVAHLKHYTTDVFTLLSSTTPRISPNPTPTELVFLEALLARLHASRTPTTSKKSAGEWRAHSRSPDILLQAVDAEREAFTRCARTTKLGVMFLNVVLTSLRGSATDKALDRWRGAAGLSRVLDEDGDGVAGLGDLLRKLSSVNRDALLKKLQEYLDGVPQDLRPAEAEKIADLRGASSADDVADLLDTLLADLLQPLETSTTLWNVWYTGFTPFPTEMLNPALRPSIISGLSYPHLYTDQDLAPEDEDSLEDLPRHKHPVQGRTRAATTKGSPAKGKGKGKGKKVEAEAEADEDERWKLGVQARFMRALHELDYLGFIKHTSRGGGGRKGEYVLRTVLGVLE
ncbi:Origin recognition complex subunit 3-like [Mycena venus]|uniref:Origin recognition complex subunit 3-like n=1 Tax=Mycena venus TaxID=2733690 RepID=A0A8H6Y8E1_9AGAR|nr:Origin recognition complex subunit 3-like [Mycena venus]